MRCRFAVLHIVGVALAAASLSACTGGTSQIGSPLRQATLYTGNPASSRIAERYGPALGGSSYGLSMIPRQMQKPFMRRPAGSWMKQLSPHARLVYISDYMADVVTVFDRNGTVEGQIGGAINMPQGVFVDRHNLWVANLGTNTVLKYDPGTTSPSKTLQDPAGQPVDITICPDRQIYVSNIIDTSSGTGSIQVYLPGRTHPTRELTYPGERENYFITCDSSGNIFTTMTLEPSSSFGIVVEYPGGSGPGVLLPIPLLYPGAIKAISKGSILVGDQGAHTITEYPSGGSITTGSSGDIVDFSVATVRDGGLIVGGADAGVGHGISWSFPGGQQRRIYNAPGQNIPLGFAYDPSER